MSNIWTEVQTLKQALRDLRDEMDGLQDAYVRTSQDRYLDGMAMEGLRVEVQRLQAQVAQMQETLREALEDEEEW
jgi:uncharacterized protein YukE